jgi:hypothetical protein
MTYEQIIEKLKPLGINVYKQTLGRDFQKSILLWLDVAQFFEGELVKGKASKP